MKQSANPDFFPQQGKGKEVIHYQEPLGSQHCQSVFSPPKAPQQEEAERFILENAHFIYLHPCQELTRINPTGPALIPVVISHSASRDFTDKPAVIPQANCAMVDKVSKSLGHLPLLHKGFSPDAESHTKKEKR